jgi:WD40 repeat-containing protein SMU1
MIPGVPITREVPVHTIELLPGTTDQIFVCTNTTQAYIMTLKGQTVRRFSSGKKAGEGGDFSCATISPQGLYCCSVLGFV